MASLKKRGDSYYVQYYLPGKIQRRINLHTDSFQIAREKLRRFESAQASGDLAALPTRTPLDEILNAYVQHIRTVKKPKSAQTDVYYLRDLFGPICDALKITSRTISAKVKKRPPKPGQDRRFTAAVIEAPCFEQIITAQISKFISGRTQSRGLAPKTANRYREILVRLFNWAADQRGLTLPGGVNPAVKVERYKESAPQIRFLTLSQIDGQLDLLKDIPKLQAMVATYIYAGLRREELLWLTHDDIDWDTKPFGLIRVRAKTIDGENWEPKTKINRAVPISSLLRPYLDKQRLRSAKSIWFFPAPGGGRWDADIIGDGRLLVQLPTGTALVHNANWGVVRIRVRPPYSKVFELGEAEVRQLVGTDRDPSKTVTAEGQRLFAVIKEHGSPPNGPLNMSKAADLAGITSKRKFLELIRELEQASVIRTRKLLERGRPRVIEIVTRTTRPTPDVPDEI